MALTIETIDAHDIIVTKCIMSASQCKGDKDDTVLAIYYIRGCLSTRQKESTFVGIYVMKGFKEN